MKITDPVRHTYLAREIQKVESAFARGEISYSQCADLVKYLESEQRKLEKDG